MALTDGKRRALPVAFGCSARRRTYIDTPEYKGLGLPMRLFRTPGAIRMPPQPSAAQTDALLAEFGVNEADARALEDCGAGAPVPHRRVTPGMKTMTATEHEILYEGARPSRLDHAEPPAARQRLDAGGYGRAGRAL